MVTPAQNPYAQPEPPDPPADSGKRERWYDFSEVSANAIGWLEAFPGQFGRLVASSLSQLADQLHLQQSEAEALKSLGAEKVLALYQSRQKRRRTDQSEELFAFLNRLQSLQADQRNTLLGHTATLVTGTRLYLKLCIDSDHAPSTRGLQGLIDSYRRLGAKGLETELRSLQASIRTAASPQISRPTPQPQPSADIPAAPRPSGMRSRRD